MARRMMPRKETKQEKNNTTFRNLPKTLNPRRPTDPQHLLFSKQRFMRPGLLRHLRGLIEHMGILSRHFSHLAPSELSKFVATVGRCLSALRAGLAFGASWLGSPS
mmetsp:Transcript_64433/g.114591  ORF Transcript_64433/g.114591 Transcript_64433/m.114591 type:complete len:106 (-) Transcript_64433:360-677(-)